MFEDFNLETACFSIQLIANASIFSARNLRMSRSVLFPEQPLPKLTSNESSTVRGSYIGVSEMSQYEPSCRTTAVAVSEEMNASEAR